MASVEHLVPAVPQETTVQVVVLVLAAAPGHLEVPAQADLPEQVEVQVSMAYQEDKIFS
jgi:hypothetical protein